MRRPRATTLVLTAALAGLAVAVHGGSGQGQATSAGPSGPRNRVFDGMAEVDGEQATVWLEPVDGAPVAFEPDGMGGMQVAEGRGRAPVGPADPEAFDALWSALRMAAVLRPVDAQADGLGTTSGSIRVVVGASRWAITLGGETPDGAGRYASVQQGDDPPRSFVVEPGLAPLLEVEADAWVSRRPVPLRASEAVEFRVPGARLQRGEDGRWRDADGGLLSGAAVDARLDALFGARLEPLAPARRDAKPWVTVRDGLGRRFTLAADGPCDSAGVPGRWLTRGPGHWGCLRGDQVDAVDGLPAALPKLVEPRLVPHAYGRILAFITDEGRVYRAGGGWEWSSDDGEQGAVVVPEPEVYRLFRQLHATTVTVAAEGSPPPSSGDARTLTVVTDSTVRLRITCARSGTCRRDGGPVLQVPKVPDLSLHRERFASRSLLDLRGEDIRAVEITPGPAGGVVRQSVHLDLGVWRLDAPVHPEGDAALDETVLEALLARLSALRAVGWEATPTTVPARIIDVQRTPRRGRETRFSIALHPDPEGGCTVVVTGQPRAGRLDPGDCRDLESDLLYRDPLRSLLRNARRATVVDGDQRRTLDALAPNWDDELARFLAWRSAGLEPVPEGQANTTVSLAVEPRDGVPVQVAVGEGWVRLGDATWRYRAAEPGGGDAGAETTKPAPAEVADAGP